MTADIYISKTLVKPRTLGQADGASVTSVKISSSADEVDTGDPGEANRVYRWNPERVEMIGKKILIEIQKSVAVSQFDSKDTANKVYDWKKVRTVYRVKGMLNDTTWNNVAKIMYFMQMIFEDGGSFKFMWQEDEFNVQVSDYQFYNEKREGLYSIHFVCDLVRMEEGTGL